MSSALTISTAAVDTGLRVSSDVAISAPLSVPLFRWTYGTINRLVMAADAVAVLAGLWLSHASGIASSVSVASLCTIGAMQAIAYVLASRWIGAYRVERYERYQLSLRDTLVASLAIAGIAAVAALVSTWFTTVPARAFAAATAVQIVCIVLMRISARSLVARAKASGLLQRRTAIIGFNASSDALRARMNGRAERANYDIVHVFAHDGERRANMTDDGVSVSPVSDFSAFARRNLIDLIVFAMPVPRALSLVPELPELQWMCADVAIALDSNVARPAVDSHDTVAGQPAVMVMRRPLKGSQALFKMIEDYIVASIALLLVAPLMLMVALAIKLDTPGPVLFRQRRTGFSNQPFEILKFRTMTTDPHDDGSIGTTTPFCPRITRVGRILRKLSIDELPQLLNVLRGDMSVVGPRPYVPNMIVDSVPFETLAQNFGFRFRLKPGITGLAQASGLRSNALRDRRNAQRSVELDGEYITSWSLRLDLVIMLKTIFLSMTGPDVF